IVSGGTAPGVGLSLADDTDRRLLRQHLCGAHLVRQWARSGLFPVPADIQLLYRRSYAHRRAGLLFVARVDREQGHVRAHSRRAPSRLSRAAAQQSVPVAIAQRDVAAAERPFRAVIELIIVSAVIRAVVASAADVEAAMIAEPRRQVQWLLPVGEDQRPHRREAELAGAASVSPSDAQSDAGQGNTGQQRFHERLHGCISPRYSMR